MSLALQYSDRLGQIREKLFLKRIELIICGNGRLDCIDTAASIQKALIGRKQFLSGRYGLGLFFSKADV